MNISAPAFLAPCATRNAGVQGAGPKPGSGAKVGFQGDDTLCEERRPERLTRFKPGQHREHSRSGVGHPLIEQVELVEAPLQRHELARHIRLKSDEHQTGTRDLAARGSVVVVVAAPEDADAAAP